MAALAGPDGKGLNADGSVPPPGTMEFSGGSRHSWVCLPHPKGDSQEILPLLSNPHPLRSVHTPDTNRMPLPDLLRLGWVGPPEWAICLFALYALPCGTCRKSTAQDLKMTATVKMPPRPWPWLLVLGSGQGRQLNNLPAIRESHQSLLEGRELREGERAVPWRPLPSGQVPFQQAFSLTVNTSENSELSPSTSP